MRYYSGIGSRETPLDIQLLMNDIAQKLSKKFVLRSGGAIGADLAFEKGCDESKGQKEIFKANDCTQEAMELSSKFHPAWNKCSYFAKKLHGRNALILLGSDLKIPVERVICWTKDGKDSGGTGQGLRIANAFDIPIYNLYFADVRRKFHDLLER